MIQKPLRGNPSLIFPLLRRDAAVRAGSPGRPSPQAPPGPQQLGEHRLQLPWQAAHAAPMDSSAGHAQNSPAALWGGWMDDDTTPNVDFFPFFFFLIKIRQGC